MNNVDKYLKAVNWARKRYSREWRLVLSVGATDSVYTRLEKALWNRYLA